MDVAINTMATCVFLAFFLTYLIDFKHLKGSSRVVLIVVPLLTVWLLWLDLSHWALGIPLIGFILMLVSSETSASSRTA